MSIFTKKSYLLSLRVSAFAVLYAASALAQSQTQCKAVEFAEMQTMNTKELEQLYCKNNSIKEFARQMIRENMDLSSKLSTGAVELAKLGDHKGASATMDKSLSVDRERTKYYENITACLVENNRVLRLIKKGNDQVEAPKCN